MFNFNLNLKYSYNNAFEETRLDEALKQKLKLI